VSCCFDFDFNGFLEKEAPFSSLPYNKSRKVLV